MLETQFNHTGILSENGRPLQMQYGHPVPGRGGENGINHRINCDCIKTQTHETHYQTRIDYRMILGSTPESLVKRLPRVRTGARETAGLGDPDALAELEARALALPL